MTHAHTNTCWNALWNVFPVVGCGRGGLWGPTPSLQPCEIWVQATRPIRGSRTSCCVGAWRRRDDAEHAGAHMRTDADSAQARAGWHVIARQPDTKHDDMVARRKNKAPVRGWLSIAAIAAEKGAGWTLWCSWDGRGGHSGRCRGRQRHSRVGALCPSPPWLHQIGIHPHMGRRAGMSLPHGMGLLRARGPLSSVRQQPAGLLAAAVRGRAHGWVQTCVGTGGKVCLFVYKMRA
jgi:hypothetical protein